jgi:2-polyprenyl-3-methyl-5-hydroxy-6-metoxy-1,4-benzoquinol methylase
MSSVEFWNNIFTKGHASGYSRIEMPKLDDPVLNHAIGYFGDIKNKKIIDLGCGRAASSLFFAYHGAKVFSVDSSDIAIKNLSCYCSQKGVKNIIPICMPAQKISRIGEVDFVFGSMVLHHIEPFKEFAANLKNVIKPKGKGFFWENNAYSKLLIYFRQHVVGKLWVPKYGDKDEFPLTSNEVNELKKYFDIKVKYPEFLYFSLISTYLLKGRFKDSLQKVDKFLYHFHAIRKYSYRQYLYLSRIN